MEGVAVGGAGHLPAADEGVLRPWQSWRARSAAVVVGRPVATSASMAMPAAALRGCGVEGAGVADARGIEAGLIVEGDLIDEVGAADDGAAGEAAAQDFGQRGEVGGGCRVRPGRHRGRRGSR